MRIRNTLLSWSVLGALVAAPAAQEQAAPPVTEAAILELIEELGDDAYRTRQGAETRLSEIGEQALEALRDAAENHDDEEVRWRARRLTQRIESGEANRLRSRELQDPERTVRPFFPRTSPDLERDFERLFSDLERNFGLDIPRTRFFGDDFFKQLEEQMGDLQREMEDRMRGGMTFGPGWNFDSSSDSVSVKIGPDGVRLEVSETNEDGETETRVYEAPDMETFREQYPDQAEQYLQGGGGLRAFTFERALPGLRSFTLEPGARSFRLSPRTLRATPRGGIEIPDAERRIVQLDPRGGIVETAPPPEGKRLGVLVTDVPVDVSRYLGLDAGRGLLVSEVEADGLAQDLGVQAGDIVLEIGGVEISTVDDVQRALGAIEAGETVEVTVNRRGREVSLEAEKKKSAERDGLRNR